MKNVQELFNIALPIIQAPMAGLQDSKLAIAVSNAGGLGSLPAAMLSQDQLENELQKITKHTNKPYNVNFFCHSQPERNPKREKNWEKILAPYYQELGIEKKDSTGANERKPFNEELFDILEKYKPPVISFHFGLPNKKCISRIKKWNAKILSTATTVEEAIWLEKHGADAVIAQGLEAGGHRGHFLSDDLSKQMGTFALVPQIVNAVNISVIAAGGIADKNGVATTLTLGAMAAQIGTAFLLCDEAKTSDAHRKAIQSPDGQHTVITNLFSGRPARGIMNRIKKELGPMNKHVPDFPLASAAINPLKEKAESQGSWDFSPLWCGENRGSHQKTCAQKMIGFLSTAPQS